jgi:hypothetical protein
MDMTTFSATLTRLSLWYLAASAVGFIATMYVLYLVVKAAIRDGIDESALVRRPWHAAPSPRIVDTVSSELPEMHASR